MSWFWLAIVALVIVSGCGSDMTKNESDQSETAIVNCVKLGGDPIYTWDQYGKPHFIICKQ